MQCSLCKSSVDEESTFCTNCGTKVRTVTYESKKELKSKEIHSLYEETMIRATAVRSKEEIRRRRLQRRKKLDAKAAELKAKEDTVPIFTLPKLGTKEDAFRAAGALTQALEIKNAVDLEQSYIEIAESKSLSMVLPSLPLSDYSASTADAGRSRHDAEPSVLTDSADLNASRANLAPNVSSGPTDTIASKLAHSTKMSKRGSPDTKVVNRYRSPVRSLGDTSIVDTYIHSNGAERNIAELYAAARVKAAENPKKGQVVGAVADTSTRKPPDGGWFWGQSDNIDMNHPPTVASMAGASGGGGTAATAGDTRVGPVGGVESGTTQIVRGPYEPFADKVNNGEPLWWGSMFAHEDADEEDDARVLTGRRDDASSANQTAFDKSVRSEYSFRTANTEKTERDSTLQSPSRTLDRDISGLEEASVFSAVTNEGSCHFGDIADTVPHPRDAKQAYRSTCLRLKQALAEAASTVDFRRDILDKKDVFSLFKAAWENLRACIGEAQAAEEQAKRIYSAFQELWGKKRTDAATAVALQLEQVVRAQRQFESRYAALKAQFEAAQRASNLQLMSKRTSDAAMDECSANATEELHAMQQVLNTAQSSEAALLLEHRALDFTFVKTVEQWRPQLAKLSDACIRDVRRMEFLTKLTAARKIQRVAIRYIYPDGDEDYDDDLFV
jgi:hypothetical protein